MDSEGTLKASFTDRHFVWHPQHIRNNGTTAHNFRLFSHNPQNKCNHCQLTYHLKNVPPEMHQPYIRQSISVQHTNAQIPYSLGVRNSSDVKQDLLSTSFRCPNNRTKQCYLISFNKTMWLDLLLTHKWHQTNYLIVHNYKQKAKKMSRNNLLTKILILTFLW